MKMLYAAMLSLVLSVPAAPVAQAADGLVQKLSAHSVQTTMDSLENLVRNKGLTVFARIDHAAGAAEVGEEMLPTQLLMFGNPAIGTNLMTSQRTVGVDLPIKVLIWEDPTARSGSPTTIRPTWRSATTLAIVMRSWRRWGARSKASCPLPPHPRVCSNPPSRIQSRSREGAKGRPL
jgi:uncharacterized protein (DUF302 family)